MLVKFGLKNFKGIVNANLNIKTITILIGANGSGKSTIGQALLLLRQSIEFNQLHPNGQFVKLGEINDLVYKNDFSNSIEFSFKRRIDGLQFSEREELLLN